MEQGQRPRGRRRHDVAAGVVVALVVGAGIAAITLAALPATFPADDVRSPTWTAAVFVIIEVAFAGTGALLVHRRQGGAIGWLLLAVAAVDGLNRLSEYWSQTAVAARPRTLPAGYGLAWTDSFTEGVVVVLLSIIVLLFPTGRPPGRRWWGAFWLVVGGAALTAFARALGPGDLEGVDIDADNPLGLEGAATLFTAVRFAGLVITFLGIVACVASVVPRWHDADAVGRLQLKWLSSVSLAVAVLVPLVSRIPEPFTVLYAVALAAFAVAVGVAIIGYRLEAIDQLLRRAAAAALVVVFVVALYAVLLLLATAIVQRPGDPFLIVLAAVVTLVAVPPAYRVATRAVDRIVLGPRAGAYDTLVGLTAQVGAAVPGEEMIARMARVVAQAVAARSAEVWVSDGTALQRAAVWPTGEPAAAAPAGRQYDVVHDGRLLGTLVVHLPRNARLTASEEQLLEDLATSSALVLENERLIAELRASRERLVEAQDGERRRIERDLHDGAQQRLVALGIDVRRARQRLADLDACAVAELFDRTGDGIQAAVDELRELARGIHPAVLTTGGLGAALRSLTDRSPVPVAVTIALPRRVPDTEAATAYFVCAEALANAARHAGATEAVLTVGLVDERLTMTITDDGCGGAAPSSGGGLAGLADRAAAVGGSLTVDSPSGRGTTITLEVPCGSS